MNSDRNKEYKPATTDAEKAKRCCAYVGDLKMSEEGMAFLNK